MPAMDLLTLFSPATPAASAPLHTPTAADWRAQWPALDSADLTPFELAVRAGQAADRLAWAFAGGYQAAIRALLPHVHGSATASLCATEPTGNRPRDIQTTLSTAPDGSLRLSGHKRWS